MLFSDLRGFTSISESLSPRQTGLLLNTYFDAMIPTVFQNNGTLDKLIGDAVMAFFGAPADLPDHPSRAALAALDMVPALEELRARSDVTGVERLAMGIGLRAAGRAVPAQGAGPGAGQGKGPAGGHPRAGGIGERGGPGPKTGHPGL